MARHLLGGFKVSALNGAPRERCLTQWRLRSLGLLVSPAMILAAACSHASTGGPAAPLEAYAEPGMLVKADKERNLNIRCTGEGGPTVVLTAGAGEQSLTWQSLQPALSAQGRICAWDRAGTGFSDPSPDDQDVEHRTGDLERLLAGAGIAPPYILVGHSIGSFETLMFAFRHPGDIAGIVLIDPSSPDQDERIRRAAPAFYAVIDPMQKGQLAQLEKCVGDAGAMSLISDPNCLTPPSTDHPQPLQDHLALVDRRTAGKRNFLSMLGSMMSGRDSAQLKAAWRPLGDIPLVVLTAGAPPPLPLTGAAADEVPKMQAEWNSMHDDIARLSSNGVNRTIAGASHYIYLDHPQAVTEAITEVRAEARSRKARGGTGSTPK